MKRFIQIVANVVNVDEQFETKRVIDVKSIREIKESGFNTSEIIFDNDSEPIYVKAPIEKVIQDLDFLSNKQEVQKSQRPGYVWNTLPSSSIRDRLNPF